MDKQCSVDGSKMRRFGGGGVVVVVVVVVDDVTVRPETRHQIRQESSQSQNWHILA